jgi:N6-L-threonylcarbamoyladenine synthase
MFPEHQPARFQPGTPINDLAAAFQAAIIDVLAVKTAQAAAKEGARAVLLAGGVAANTALRQRLRDEVVARCGPDVPVRVPPMDYCTDNAAMVAGAAYFALRRGDQAGWESDIQPRLALDEVSAMIQAGEVADR